MNIFQLVCFAALSGASTFSETAEKLYISQSSFSNNIQSLERELDVNLVIRGSRSISYTDAGRALLVYAEKIIKEYERLTKLLLDYRQSAENRVLIYTDPLSGYGYNAALVSFKYQFPEIQTEVVELIDEKFDDILKTQKDAIGIVFSTNKAAYPGTKCYTLVSDRLAAFVNKNHRFAGRESLKMHELSDEMLQIISYRQSRFLNCFTLEQFSKSGFVPTIAPYDLWYNTIQETIRGLRLTAVIPERVAKVFCQQDMRVICIDTEEFYIKVVISDECTHSAALKFFNFFKSCEKIT